MIFHLSHRHAPSLRWRLLGLVSIACALILGLAAQLTYRQARHEVQEMMDFNMSKMAQLMLIQAQQGADHLADLPAALSGLRGLRAGRSQMALEYRVGTAGGALLVRSPLAPDAAPSGPPGFSTITQDGHPWRSLILETGDAAYRIQVTQSVSSRDKEALEIAVKTVLPLAVLFPLLIAAIYFSVRQGLKPLESLAHEVSGRSPENLTPLAPAAIPREAQALVAAINRLMYRLSGSLENERRFTADAAHELRTPLAATRIQTQVALLTGDQEQRNHALSQAMAGLDRATRMVDQLLRLARLDPLAELARKEPVDLAGLVNDAVAGVLDTAPERRIEARIDSPATRDADPDLLHIALRNLIDNALRYSLPESTIEVVLCHQEGGLRMEVRDEGPGVPAADLPRIAERFYRGSAVQAEGSGLGLAIVARIAELHGARLELLNRDTGGFIARLCWPD